MKDDIIFSRLAASTAFDAHFFAPWCLYKRSSGWEGPFDFSTKIFFADRQNYLFITDNIYGKPGYLDGISHNYRNMGNFLWSAATYIMGVNKYFALTGGHFNNIINERNGFWGFSFDSPDDQWSIQLGRSYAKKPGYRGGATGG